MVEALEELKEAWKVHQEVMLGNPLIENEHPDVQRILAQSSMRAQFSIALPRLLDYERKYFGGVFDTYAPRGGSNFEPIEKTGEAS